MFTKLYIEKNLFEPHMDKLLRGNLKNAVDIIYSTADEMQSMQFDREKSVFAGCSNAFLDIFFNKYAVIAVLSNSENSNLFKYKYAVEEVSSIDMDYLEMIYARFNGLPLVITATCDLLIREMNISEACRLFELSYQYPEIFEEHISTGKENVNFKEEKVSNREAVVNFKEEKVSTGEMIRDLAESYIRNAYDLQGYGMWSVIRSSDSEFIGYVGLYDSVCNNKTYTLISYYVEPQHRRMGYATKAVEAVLNYAKDSLGIEDIRCVVRKDNIVSKKIAGFFNIEFIFK